MFININLRMDMTNWACTSVSYPRLYENTLDFNVESKYGNTGVASLLSVEIRDGELEAKRICRRYLEHDLEQHPSPPRLELFPEIQVLELQCIYSK